MLFVVMPRGHLDAATVLLLQQLPARIDLRRMAEQAHQLSDREDFCSRPSITLQQTRTPKRRSTSPSCLSQAIEHSGVGLVGYPWGLALNMTIE
jgi:hypothetical protein